ncbi:glycoside hydrolase family 16 protein [Mangrovibacterium lignilyticum]|uniref:glycoside hydrolase family 16 protein n=1 Tax=Mangrovibacterium lignilyticum TaxID=2668052 RepID=UPI0013D4D5E3|nr:glycoside hydrolase family 16 protein [Mangrovibacterium lignilyticum]
MSFKLFFLSTFKGLKNTPKVESKRDSLWADFQVYESIQESEDLKLYLELDHYVNSEAFKKERSETKALKFAGSPESKLISEYQKLEKDSQLKDFYVTQSSADFQKYQLLDQSENIREFVALRDFIQSAKYEEEKANFKAKQGKGGSEVFEETATYQKYETFQKLSKSEDVLFWKEFPGSKMYKNYKEMVNSPKRVRYEELKAEVESEAFEMRKAFLEDDNRWEKTAAFQKEKTYMELKNEPRFQVFEKYKKSNEFQFFQNHELLLEDHFEEGQLDGSKWKSISPMAENTVGKNFSKAGDLQAYTNGENILQTNSFLKLAVKQEKTDSLVWNFPIGFNPVSFDYSAGLLNSAQSYKVKSGVLEAKIKYQPNKQLVDLFYLSDDKNSFRLNLLESGTVCQFGVSEDKGSQSESLKGLAAGHFYIFRIEWGQGRICWKINNHEIYSVQQSVPDAPLRINMSSIVVEPPRELPHYFEVDWVRLYRKK